MALMSWQAAPLGSTERHLEDGRAVAPRGPHGGFVAGIGDHHGSVRARECQHRVVERIARAGVRHDPVGIEAFLFGEDLDGLGFERHQVAAAAGNDVDHRFAGGFAGTHGVLVGVDVDAAVGIGEGGPGGPGQMGLGDGHGGKRRCAGGETEEGAAGDAATGSGISGGWHMRKLLRGGGEQKRAQAADEPLRMFAHRGEGASPCVHVTRGTGGKTREKRARGIRDQGRRD